MPSAARGVRKAIVADCRMIRVQIAGLKRGGCGQHGPDLTLPAPLPFIKGKELTADERRACCQIVRPETIPAWFRQLAAKKYDSSKAPRVARPGKVAAVRELVLELARDNP